MFYDEHPAFDFSDDQLPMPNVKPAERDMA